MIKLKGAISGFAGGMLACLFGTVFLWRILHLLNAIVAVFQGEQIPDYRPFYTLEQAGGVLLIVGFFTSVITLILWAIAGAVMGHWAQKRCWQQKKVFRSWLTWGISFAVICLVAFVIPFWSEGSVSDLEFLRVALFLFVWWTACGLSSGAVSAKLFTRWVASNKHLAEPNLFS